MAVIAMQYGHAACSGAVTKTAVQNPLLLLSTSFVIFHTSIILQLGLAEPFRQLAVMGLILNPQLGHTFVIRTIEICVFKIKA